MAPQTTEFGTKVALLGGLALICACRPLLDRLVPEPGSTDGRRLAAGHRAGTPSPAGARASARSAGASSWSASVPAIVAAGARRAASSSRRPTDVLGRVPHDVNPATFPTISVEQDVLDWNHEISGAGRARDRADPGREPRAREPGAAPRGRRRSSPAVDHGDRLDEMRDRLQNAAASGTTVVEQLPDRRRERHPARPVRPAGRPEPRPAQSRGTVTTETYDAAGHLQARTSSPFATTFVVRRATGGRWLNVAVLPTGDQQARQLDGTRTGLVRSRTSVTVDVQVARRRRARSSPARRRRPSSTARRCRRATARAPRRRRPSRCRCAASRARRSTCPPPTVTSRVVVRPPARTSTHAPMASTFGAGCCSRTSIQWPIAAGRAASPRPTLRHSVTFVAPVDDRPCRAGRRG